MDKEYHYHVNYIIAKMGGFDAQIAERIAHSSQLTDDNIKNFKILLPAGKCYSNQISQSIDIRIKTQKLNHIYQCFHFQPGCLGARENETFWLTQANSPFSQEMLKKALEVGDPYLIGIASHAFADTYAHHGFCGHSSQLNNPLGLRNIINYGHLYFGDLPDLIGVKWYDIRHKKTVDNNRRFLRASLELLAFYLRHNGAGDGLISQQQQLLEALLTQIWGCSVIYFPGINLRSRVRINQYKKYLVQLGCGEQITQISYSPKTWLQQAARYEKSTKTWVANEGFYSSHWFNFQEAIKVYQQIFGQNKEVI
jgi:hypothetical protein